MSEAKFVDIFPLDFPYDGPEIPPKGTAERAVVRRELSARFQRCIDMVEDVALVCWHQRDAHMDWAKPPFVSRVLATIGRKGGRFSSSELDWIEPNVVLALAVLEAEEAYKSTIAARVRAMGRKAADDVE